ncbi:MAG: MBL fold metallo-hydrolase [Candidatus Andersenbacteria bacterium]
MQITWHGQYTIKITSKDAIVVLDPYSPDVGLPPFRAKADIVSLTNPSDSSMSHLGAIQGDPLIVNTPGEYSFRGLSMNAQSWYTEDGVERNIQLWQIEGMTLVHLGALNRELTDKELQDLERTGIDILLISVGGQSGLNTEQALSFITTLEPRVVIPIHYKLPKLKEALDPVDQFAKEMGVSSSQKESKVILKASKLPQEDMDTIILAA